MAEGLSMPYHNYKAHLPRDPGRVQPVAHNRDLNKTPSYQLFFSTFNPKNYHAFINLLRYCVHSTL